MKMADYFISGWSFFFRWPVANATVFRPLGIFLGPLLQSLVFFSFSLAGVLFLTDGQRQWAPLFGLVGLSMLTGFFHEDGLADTADSLGVSKFDSAASLEKIHSTFKDPRLGTFGVSALVLLWLLRIVAVAQAELSILVWAFVCLISRATSLGFGLYFSSRSALARNPRSSHVMQSVDVVGASFVLAAGVFLGLLLSFGLGHYVLPVQADFVIQAQSASILRLFLCALVSMVLSYFVFAALVRRTEALNGDLLGALVCFSEIILTFCILRIF
jgi:cobalamin synthase